MKPSWKNFACAGLFAVLSSPVFAGDINFCIIDAQNPSTIGDIFPHEPVVLHCFNREGDEATNKLDTCAAASKDGLGTLDSETLDICLNSPADAQQIAGCVESSSDMSNGALDRAAFDSCVVAQSQ